MEEYEIRRLIDEVRKEVDDVRYDLRRAIEDVEGQVRSKADKCHAHDE